MDVAILEEGALPLHNLPRHPLHGVPTVLHPLQERLGVRFLLLQVLHHRLLLPGTRLPRRTPPLLPRLLLQHPQILIGKDEGGKRLPIDANGPVARRIPFHKGVRLHGDGDLRGEPPGGTGRQGAEALQGLLHLLPPASLLQGNPLLRLRLPLRLLQFLEMAVHQLPLQAALLPLAAQLNQKALPQVPRPDARRLHLLLEGLDGLAHLLQGTSLLPVQGLPQLLVRALQVAVLCNRLAKHQAQVHEPSGDIHGLPAGPLELLQEGGLPMVGIEAVLAALLAVRVPGIPFPPFQVPPEFRQVPGLPRGRGVRKALRAVHQQILRILLPVPVHGLEGPLPLGGGRRSHVAVQHLPGGCHLLQEGVDRQGLAQFIPEFRRGLLQDLHPKQLPLGQFLDLLHLLSLLLLLALCQAEGKLVSLGNHRGTGKRQGGGISVVTPSGVQAL